MLFLDRPAAIFSGVVSGQQEDVIPVVAVKPGMPLVRWHSQAKTNIALTLGGTGGTLDHQSSTAARSPRLWLVIPISDEAAGDQ